MFKRQALFGTAVALVLGVIAACGSDDDNKKDDTGTTAPTSTALTFTADINPIIKSSCGGTDCHGKGATRGGSVFEDAETTFKASTTPTRLSLDASNPLF